MSTEVKVHATPAKSARKGAKADSGVSLKSVTVLGQETPDDETLHAIAAGVADYVSQGKKTRHQVRFAPNDKWVHGTRIAQLNHLPVR